MSRETSSQPPRAAPPVCWLLAGMFLIAVAAAFAGVAVGVDTPASESFAAFNRARLAEAAATQPSTLVIMLGNSRLKYATLSDEQLARRAGNGARVVRIVNNWAVLADFEPLLEPILSAAPSLVVLQEDLFTADWSYLNRLRHLREYARWRLFGSGPWNPGGLDQRALQFDAPCFGEVSEVAVRERLRRTGKWLRERSPSESIAAVDRFLTRAREAGSEVVVLSIPRSRPMEVARPAQPLSISGAALGGAGVEHWQYSEPLEDAHFCDTIHLNHEGRELFSTWLINKLESRS